MYVNVGNLDEGIRGRTTCKHMVRFPFYIVQGASTWKKVRIRRCMCTIPLKVQEGGRGWGKVEGAGDKVRGIDI